MKSQHVFFCYSVPKNLFGISPLSVARYLNSFFFSLEKKIIKADKIYILRYCLKYMYKQEIMVLSVNLRE